MKHKKKESNIALVLTKSIHEEHYLAVDKSCVKKARWKEMLAFSRFSSHNNRQVRFHRVFIVFYACIKYINKSLKCH